ncbi:hypothetical protein SAMN06295912_1415 [Sphingomonas laterariae]|uniref:Glycosyl transferase family 2 n=2 Tax=Edaphosphingomonas laterariae TaxID=861865 RepID=A0A239JZA1_9SPHN|nr:hypothetical protein SAMN06295912_1415 [Sphingomonas laterariae]
MLFLADQDDVWLPGKVATIKRELAERELVLDQPFILFHDVRVVDEALHPIRDTYYTGNPFLVPRDLNRCRLLMANPAIGHTMLISSPLARKLVHWPDAEAYLMHDWQAILIASRLGRVEHVPLALSLYRQHDSNVLGAYRTRGFASVSRLQKFVDRMIGQAVCFSRTTRQWQDRGDHIHTTWLETLCRQGYRQAAIALSVAALAYGPTWQRKAIGALLLTRAIMGPIRNKTVRGNA